jgi:putative ATP-binding cassette transporter
MSFFSEIAQLLRFLSRWGSGIRHGRLAIVLILLTGAVSGFTNAALIAVINRAVSGSPSLRTSMLWLFIGFCALLPLSRFVSGAILLRIASSAVYQLRVQLSRRILSARLRTLEELGPHRLLATLTEDIPAITNALTSLPNLCMQLFIVVGCLIYLWWLSWQSLIAVLVFLVVGVITYQLPTRLALRHFDAARESWDLLMKSFRSLTEGTKELKLHSGRRKAFFFEELEPAAASVQRSNVTGHTIFLGATSWGHVLFFVLVGVVIFAMPSIQELDPLVLTGFALTILYMMTPLEGIMDTLPRLGLATVSARKIESLGLSLLEAGQDAEVSSTEPASRPDWRTFELRGATHTYRSEAGDGHFTLGPLDLSIDRGELIFVIGGNGSGKTTLAKLLTGLYTPEQGEIVLDGQVITEGNREAFRQQFTAVFSDFFLFERLLGLPSPVVRESADTYLQRLRLSQKVTLRDGALSTVDLSRGQRKRLALLTAYLEDRPIYVFDEWAADQDPEFKAIFYHQLLPELKARGKTTIVISHDDRYYGVADRLIGLEYGQIVRDETPAGRPELEEVCEAQA